MNQEKNQERGKNIAEFWRHILFHNLSIKLLSFVGALLVWLLIINIDDPYKTKTFLVHVETTNEEALSSVHKVYEVVEGSSASVSVRGKRSVIDDLETTDISATADLSELSSVNAVAIKATLKKNTSSDVQIECNQVLKVSLEDMESKQMKVSVEAEGTPTEGYSVGECIAKPNVIEVTGGESVIDRIYSVKVTINVNGASESFSKRVEPVAYDKKGNRVTSSTLSFGSDLVIVRAKLLQNKTIPVKVQVKGTPAAGYEFVEASCLPEEIDIAGASKKLDGISQIVIPINIDKMTSASSQLEQDIDVEDYLKDGITVPEEYQRVSVKITVEKLQKKKIQLAVNGLKLTNVGNGYVAEAYVNSGNVELTIQGRESVLKELPDTAFSGYVNCDGLKEGTYQLPVEIDLGNTCRVLKRAKVNVLITKKSSASNSATMTPKPTATSSPTKNTSTPEASPGKNDE